MKWSITNWYYHGEGTTKPVLVITILVIGKYPNIYIVSSPPKSGKCWLLLGSWETYNWPHCKSTWIITVQLHCAALCCSNKPDDWLECHQPWLRTIQLVSDASTSIDIDHSLITIVLNKHWHYGMNMANRRGFGVLNSLKHELI